MFELSMILATGLKNQSFRTDGPRWAYHSLQNRKVICSRCFCFGWCSPTEEAGDAMMRYDRIRRFVKAAGIAEAVARFQRRESKG